MDKMQSTKIIYLKGAKLLDSNENIKPVLIEIDLNRRKITFSFTEKYAIFFTTKEKLIVHLEHLNEIVKGMETNNFRNMRNELLQETPPERCLSITLKKDIDTIDLIAPTETIRDKWYKTFTHILELALYRQIKFDFNQHIKDRFRETDTDNSNTLTYDEILKLLDNLNIKLNKRYIRTLYEKANFRKSSNKQTNKSWKKEVLDIDEFVEFYSNLSLTKILDKEFKKLSFGGFIDCDHLKKFMKSIQKYNSLNMNMDCLALISKYEQVHVNSDRHFLTNKGFQNMIISSDFDIVDKKLKDVNQDMLQPLHSYYIATSHNTYLPSDQLVGSSTIETYRLYLLDGCRCVEIDINDGDEESDYEPVIFHKHTLTAKVKLIDVVETINDYAFKNSPYPVIISLENNCKELESTRKAATIFQAVFKDKLITGPLDPNETKWPSPEQLRGRIIIKGKKLPEECGSSIKSLEEKHNLAKDLSDLVYYCFSKHFKSFEESKWSYKDMTSIEEGKSSKFSLKNKEEYRKFTSKYLTKVYPFGLRFFSSNYDPIPHWDAGAQMVALNYQTNTHHMKLNECLFETNGSCGYVLKADHILHSENIKPLCGSCMVHIRVLCALNLPEVKGKKLNPFVQIRVFGVKKYRKRRRQTSYVLNNGFNPEWNRKFKFNIPISNTSLCFFQFRVFDMKFCSKNEPVGQRMIALNTMCEGYRNIDLYDSQDRKIEMAKLIVVIKKDWQN